MGEPAGDVGGGDGGESGPGGGAEGVIGAGVRASEELFDRGEGVLDRIEVRGVGGQGQEASAACLDGRADGRVMMGGEVVGDDDLAWSEGGGEAVADLPHEAVGRHGAVEPQEWSDTRKGQRRDHGLVLTSIGRRGRVGALADRRPGVGGGVAQMAAGLIQEHQIRWMYGRHLLPPGRPSCRLAFTRRQRLFFRDHPSFVSARLIVAVLTSTPETSRHQEHCSSNVASARSARRSGNAATSAFVVTAGGPSNGRAATPPVSRFSLNHRSIVGTETANIPPTSSRGVPTATALTTRSRRSSEYARIP